MLSQIVQHDNVVSLHDERKVQQGKVSSHSYLHSLSFEGTNQGKLSSCSHLFLTCTLLLEFVKVNNFKDTVRQFDESEAPTDA